MFNVLVDDSPRRISEHDNSDFSTFQILLVADILVSGEQNLEARVLCKREPLPFEIVSHPRSLASVTSWPVSESAMPDGTPWSKRMRIRRSGGIWLDKRRCVKAAGREFENCNDLLACNVELLDDFFDVGTGFQVFKNRGDWHTRVLKNPCTAAAVGNAFYCGTLRPIKNSHTILPFHRTVYAFPTSTRTVLLGSPVRVALEATDGGRMQPNYTQLLQLALVPGVFALSGALIGALISGYFNLHAKRKEYVNDYYTSNWSA